MRRGNGNILYFLGTILVIAILWLINRKIMSGLIYAELAKVEDSQIKHVSEYKFFERYGEVGEYMRLELKMLLRNRRCKGALRNIAIDGTFEIVHYRKNTAKTLFATIQDQFGLLL